ncbi:hypothetical protein D3C81_2306230 [compost metagenome]
MISLRTTLRLLTSADVIVLALLVSRATVRVTGEVVTAETVTSTPSARSSKVFEADVTTVSAPPTPG